MKKGTKIAGKPGYKLVSTPAGKRWTGTSAGGSVPQKPATPAKPAVSSPSAKTSVRHLQAGDVLDGSGFTVTRKPYVLASKRLPKGKVYIEGNYPGSPVKVHVWNASTTVSVAPKE